MTYIVSGGALYSTHPSTVDIIVIVYAYLFYS